MDKTGETFTPTGKQLSDKGTTVHLHSGVAMEAGAGANFVPEAPLDGEIYGRGSVAGAPLWVRLSIDVLPPSDNLYYAVRNGQFEAVQFEFQLLAKEIKVDPPLFEKTNLQEVLEAIVERMTTPNARSKRPV